MLFYVGSFSYNFTSYVLVCLGSFSCTPHATWCGQFLLHVHCCSVWGVSLTRPMLFYVGSFSYTPLAVSRGEFLLHAPCCFMWGVSLTCPVLFSSVISLTRPMLFYVGSFSSMPLLFYVGSLSYTPSAICFWEFVLQLHTLCYFVCSPYTPCAVLCGECFLHTLCYLMWEICVTHPVLFYVVSLSDTPNSRIPILPYTPHASFSGEFLLHVPC